METKVLAKAAYKVNEFYKTNAALFFFMSMTTIFALLQVILYSLDIMKVTGHISSDAPSPILSWIMLLASIFACYAGFVGGIMLFRGSLSFVYWQNVSTLFAVLTQALASMWFGAFVSVYFIIMNLTRYYVWKNELLEKWNWSPEKVVTIGIVVFFVVLIALNSMSFFWGDVIYSADTAIWMEPKNYQFDATGATFNITASFMMLFKSRWSFLLYALGKIFTIWNYADAGLIVPIVQMMLFWIMDATGFIGWSLNSIEPTDTVIETDFE